MLISIVIPAYNESQRLPQTLANVQAYLEYNYPSQSEIIVVDDGSSDDTLQRIPTDIKTLSNERNQGKGFSVRRGALAATGDYIIFSDADLSTPIEDLEKLITKLQNGADIAIGSRALPTSNIEIEQSRSRQLMGRFFNLLVRMLLVKGIKDTQCGFKAFSQKAARQIFPHQKTSGFCFDVELLYLATKANLKIVEVPVTWRNSINTKVNVLRDPALMFLDLLRIRRLHRHDHLQS